MITATVGDVLRKKGSKVITVEVDQPVRHAVEAMVRHNVGSVLITQNGTLCGIFTERDILRKIVLQTAALEMKVLEIATCNLVAVDPTCSIEEALAIMTDQRCRHLPVMEGGELVGLVSIGDLVRQATLDRKFHIRFLTDYIANKSPA